jgi:MraZ protein
MHGCLWVFSDDEWREFQKTVTPKTPWDSDGLRLERFFVGSAVECTTDTQGRVIIPEDLRAMAGITDETYVVGVGKKVEIWSKSRYDEFKNSHTDEVIQQLGAARQVAFV